MDRWFVAIGMKMPNGWVHSAITLVAFGRPYFDIHRDKDWPCRTLGSAHRIVNHEWYQAYESLWTLAEPFPAWINRHISELGEAEGDDAAEKEQVSVSHDHADRIWDDLPLDARKYWEGFFLWLLLNPPILKTWAGVDVLEGSIQRMVDGREVWELCPELTREYARLRCYVEVVKGRDPVLRKMLVTFG